MRIGIMQGRLVPPIENRIQCFPRDRWADELPAAQQAGLETIEWIYDLYGADVNPITTDAGIERLKTLCKKHNVQILSLCADYFMDRPLLRATSAEVAERLQHLKWLIAQAQSLGVKRVVLPFVDASRIETEAEKVAVVAALNEVLPLAEKLGVELHLETALSPTDFAAFLARIPHPMVKVNYDSGNSSSLGYKPREEFAAYGDHIGSVHIKDRVLGGTTVPLGTGNADFKALVESLRAVKYSGDYILQVARGVPGNEVEWAKQNRAFWLKQLSA
ncbi:MAG: sugar phosphate isomerase/epimerase family protein [Limisphaerales bacterium]